MTIFLSLPARVKQALDAHSVGDRGGVASAFQQVRGFEDFRACRSKSMPAQAAQPMVDDS